MRLAGSIAAALLAVFLWRNGRLFKNILVPIQLPSAYFVGGDAQSQCRLIKDTVSHKLKYCEDATFWDVADGHGGIRDRRLLVTCDPGRKQWNTVMGPLRDPSPRGALWVYAPKAKAKSQLLEVTFDNYPGDADFHPLGVDVLPGPSSTDPSHVLVVNHGRNSSTIEHFSLLPVEPYRATYVRTLADPRFVAPNAVAFTSPTSFYVTQDHRFTRRLPGLMGKILPVVESLLLPGLAWVNHVNIRADGQLDVAYAAQGVAFANGIAISADGRKVAVSSSSGGGVHLYNRTVDNKLKFEETVLLPFTPDNVGFEDDGILVVAGHPNFPAISAVAAQKREHAPSWVVAIVPRTKAFNASEVEKEDIRAPCPVTGRVPISRSHEVTTLYQSDGTAFSTSATGLWDARSGTFYAAGLYQEGILSCQGGM